MIIQGPLKTDDYKALRTRGAMAPYLAGGHTWVLAMDQQRALVFVRTGQSLESLGMLRAHEDVETTGLKTSKDGASIDGSHDQSKYQPPVSELRQTELGFIRELAAWLNHAANDKAFDHLIIVAGPRSLGELRAALHPAVTKMVTEEINKDVANMGRERLLQELPRLIPGPERLQ